MIADLFITLPLVLAAVLVASGVAKFRSPDDLDGWRDLGVPAALRLEWLRVLHPWGELVLGVAIATLGGWLGVLAAVVAVALMLAYTVLIVRVAARPESTTCACFGARKRVTMITVVRNLWLTALAVGSAAVIWMTPALGGALAAGILALPWLLVALAVTAVTVTLVLWPDSVTGVSDEAGADAVAQAVAQSQRSDDDLDYIRTRTPAVPVTLADGSERNLRRLAETKPILLLSVSSTCGACTTVIEQVGPWRELLPEVDIRLLLAALPKGSALVEFDEPQSLHDPDGYARESLQALSTPTAVLLGVDGLLAGGPVMGPSAIGSFVDDIYESLHGERPVREGVAS